MSNSEDVPLFESFRRLLVRSHELAEKIFTIDDFLAVFLPLVEFFERHARDQRLARIHARQELCDRVPPQQEVPLWDLAYDTIIPLYFIDCLDRAFEVTPTFEEPELP